MAKSVIGIEKYNVIEEQHVKNENQLRRKEEKTSNG